MYTPAMKRAFRSLDSYCPRGFDLDIMDHGDFLTIRVYPDNLAKLTIDRQEQAVEYLARVKNALEDNGAIVMIVRSAIK